jgi:hypothetical protein
MSHDCGIQGLFPSKCQRAKLQVLGIFVNWYTGARIEENERYISCTKECGSKHLCFFFTTDLLSWELRCSECNNVLMGMKQATPINLLQAIVSSPNVTKVD